MKTIILLLLIILLIVPQELLNNDKLTAKLADLESRLGAMESARQPYVGDWYSFSVASISYSSATRINVTDTTITAILRIGDKVKITQTTDKYFYIVNVNSTSIDVYAGDDFSVANAPITYFGFSRLSTPSGHSILFSRTIPAGDIIGVNCTANNLISPTQKFYMIGNVIFVHNSFGFDIPSVGAANRFVSIKHPIQRTSSGNYLYIQPSTVGRLLVTGTLEHNTLYHSASNDSGNSAYLQRGNADFVVSVYNFQGFYYYGIKNQ